jgi:phytoene dehydrogenase-like protein
MGDNVHNEQEEEHPMRHDGHGQTVTVVGGGLAGLTAATYLARSGHAVTLCEKSSTLGGRAATQETKGYLFNLGPHALYRKSHGVSVLCELGVTYTGRSPGASGGYAIDHGAKHALPGGLMSLLTTSLFGVAAKLETARLLAGLQRLDAASFDGVTIRAWSEQHVKHPDVRRFILAVLRLATYGNDPERQSAGSAIRQLQLALSVNVAYLDGGWQTLVDGLGAQAIAAGVDVRTGAGVTRVEPDGRVHLRDGSVLDATAVVLATDPDVAADLVVGGRAGMLGRWAKEAIPVKAACLDVALATLPEPRATFALGIDRPLYCSVHSASAKLAPEGGAVIHVARYLGSEKLADPRLAERELEGVLDLVRPGWQRHVVERRFLPAMTVTHGLVTAAAGGVSGRPGPAVPDMPNVFVAGDWVGTEGQLADASLASARRAAALIAARRETSAAA